ncbi:MAG: hypothetical protein LUH02_01895 [Erysipelotrichaceae bacterium]|nr:hypothetical protein [Erysipelotrichaceae bacterium]
MLKLNKEKLVITPKEVRKAELELMIELNKGLISGMKDGWITEKELVDYFEKRW